MLSEVKATLGNFHRKDVRSVAYLSGLFLPLDIIKRGKVVRVIAQ